MSSSHPVSAYDSETFGKDGSFRVDKPVGSASISPCGRDVVLASRQGLHIIDLDSPWSPPRHLPHHTPWEVADVQWSPFAARDYWVVSTSNQKALVWNLSMVNSQASIEHVLHAHSRAITDINFSAHHPDILATCAVDSFVHCWDLRHPTRPAMTFCDWFAGATQVKWNRRDSHILASSHDKFLRIWDDRKGAYPLRSIEAHATKIYGVDWSRLETSRLVTCSLDKTIKFWDYESNTDEPERVINTRFPVWRARHTPFGYGLLALPQRDDHDLHLYDRRVENEQHNGFEAVHQFGGHQNQVKEFLWRARGTVTDNVDDREFQLVSWSTDRLLRLHEVDEDVSASVGYAKGMKVKRTVNFTRRDAKYKTFRDDPCAQNRKLSQDSGLDFQLNIGQSGASMSSGLANGMSRSSVAFLRGYENEGFMSSMVGKRSSSSRDMDPITWMQGVKIGKREPSSSGMQQSVSTILSPTSKKDPPFDQFESLGEEISSSGAKFPKITFDEVDVQRRRIVVSLSGPWGVEGNNTHIRLSLDFPAAYPTGAAPVVAMQNMASMNEETVLKVSSEVDTIASSFMSSQRHSLEAILRYLLGEQSLTESLTWLKKHRDSGALDTIQDADLSSSDEDDADLDAPHADALESSDPMLIVSNAQYNVPLPKACGALWANNGLLVCFFPVKQDRDVSFLDQSLKASERSYRSRRNVFEGFGRLQNEPNRARRGTSTLETIDSDLSEVEDFESSSSGSTSSSAIDEIHYNHRCFMPSVAWRGNTVDSNQRFSLDDSQRSSGENALTTASKANMFVSIHDFTELLPSKQKFGKMFQIGSTHQIAAHNAQVAKESGDPELEGIWTLIELILQDKVPIDAFSRASEEEPMMMLVHRALSPLKAQDSAVDLSFDGAEDGSQQNGRQPVKWGDHPFGRQWLVRALFCHFEEQANVQMLAMLSCIFSPQQKYSFGENSVNVMESYSMSRQPSDALNYYPSEAVAKSFFDYRPSGLGLSIDVDPHRISSDPQSATSSNDATASEPLGISSGSGTPPGHRRMRSNTEGEGSRARSASTSPELQRHDNFPSSNLNEFSSSLPRALLFPRQSASSSPPKVHQKMRDDPDGGIGGPAQSSITWAPSGFFGRAQTALEGQRSALSLSLSDADEDTPASSPAKKPIFTTQLKNQDQFHNEGHATLTLLDPQEDWRYLMYRQSYAHLLYIWDMPLARAELLNYNHSPQPENQPMELRKASLKEKELSRTEKLAIDFVGQKTREPPICLFCNTFIRGLFSPCLQCGHILHDSCRATLLHDGIEECVSGCGCVCTDHTSIEMPMPEEKPQIQAQDQSPALTFTDDTGFTEPEPFVRRESAEWEDVAYTSLARNLMGERRGSGKGVRARPSQIWRG